MKWKATTIIHDSFEVSIAIKALDGFLQVIGAILILFIRPETISKWVYALAKSEFIFDSDRISNQLVLFASHYTSGSQIFATLYLASHGLIKLFLIFNLWKKRLWAYPTAIVVFLLFIIYQMQRYWHTHEISMIALTVLDVIVIVLTYLEYQQIKRQSS